MSHSRYNGPVTFNDLKVSQKENDHYEVYFCTTVVLSSDLLGPEFRHQNQNYTNNEINADYKKIHKIRLNKMENAGRRGKQ